MTLLCPAQCVNINRLETDKYQNQIGENAMKCINMSLEMNDCFKLKIHQHLEASGPLDLFTITSPCV